MIPLLAEAAVTTYGLRALWDTGKKVREGEQSVDPRKWTAEQWQMMAIGGTAGSVSTVLALQRGGGASGTILRVILTRSLMRPLLPAYGVYVFHDTVMNPGSDYYISPDTPLVPGRSGFQLFGGDVGSKLMTAAAQDIGRLLS